MDLIYSTNLFTFINIAKNLQCFPVYSLLLSVGNPKVNLFVLDIEGYELAILRYDILFSEKDWSFKSMSAATANASAANKTWIFKRKLAVVSQKYYRHTRGSLAAVNDYCHRAGGCFSSAHHCHFSC